MKTLNTTFKRLPIGKRFVTSTGAFRKVSEKSAFAVTVEGRGKTHERINFSRSAVVTIVNTAHYEIEDILRDAS